MLVIGSCIFVSNKYCQEKYASHQTQPKDINQYVELPYKKYYYPPQRQGLHALSFSWSWRWYCISLMWHINIQMGNNHCGWILTRNWNVVYNLWVWYKHNVYTYNIYIFNCIYISRNFVKIEYMFHCNMNNRIWNA